MAYPAGVQNTLITSANASATARRASLLHCVDEATWPQWLQAQPQSLQQWLVAQQFKPERHRWLALPSLQPAEPCDYVVGLGSAAAPDLALAAALADKLPAGQHALAQPLDPAAATQFALGWLMGGYRFDRYRKATTPADSLPQLLLPAGADRDYAVAAARADALARDLINTPANDLGPAELEAAARSLAAAHNGAIAVVQGDELRQLWPLIDAVGRASARAPRLIELRFEREGAARVTLVGKGVCFDSGGLNLKPSSGMLLMKKDMGGAACTLALAQMLLDLDAPVALRILLPAVDNSVSGDAFRPGDVLRSRQGTSIEIGNTDAEGRLVLADALADAAAEQPALLIDMATLTGAARVALGPDLPAAFGSDRQLVADLQAQGDLLADPLWPLPLWRGYDDDLSSRIADINNAGSSGFAGAITAALFLARFVPQSTPWLHLDLYGWNPRERAGKPQGAQTQCVRALYGLIRQRFG